MLLTVCQRLPPDHLTAFNVEWDAAEQYDEAVRVAGAHTRPGLMQRLFGAPAHVTTAQLSDHVVAGLSIAAVRAATDHLSTVEPIGWAADVFEGLSSARVAGKAVITFLHQGLGTRGPRLAWEKSTERVLCGAPLV